MFYCDLFHTLNLSRLKGKCNKLTLLSQIRHTLDVYPLREAKRPRSSTIFFMQYGKATVYSASNNCSNSFNFSSNTRQASSIGAAVFISTPAFFNTSIG